MAEIIFAILFGGFLGFNANDALSNDTITNPNYQSEKPVCASTIGANTDCRQL